MTKNRRNEPFEDPAFQVRVAEETLILHAQMLIQGMLLDHGMSQKELADRLGVKKSYVSQMLGTSPRNLTLRTIARVMCAFDEEATLVLESEAQAASVASVEEPAAVASRVAAAELSQVWGQVIPLPTRTRPKRGQGGDAKAYAAYNPPVVAFEPAAIAAMVA